MSGFTGAMDPWGLAGVPSRRDGQGSNEGHPTYSSRPITISGSSQRHDSVGNGGATGPFFDQDPHSGQVLQQGGVIPDPRAYPGVYKGYETNSPFEYDRFAHRHAPATEHNHLHESLPSNSFMGVNARTHSTAPSSSPVWSGLRTLAPALSHRPAPSSTSYASPSQGPLESPAFSQYLSHAQTSSPLQAMVSNSQGPSEPDAIKLSDEQTEAIKALLRQHGWYVVPDEEPAIRPDDPFITQGLILPTDKTRFGAFVFSTSTGGRTFCRIKHSIPTKNKPCTFSAAHPKDAIAHVCDYLSYRPYKCKGTRWHVECDSTYPTKERRNDHYAKKKKGPDFQESCECGASITTRNVARHKGRCPNIKNLQQS